MSYDKKRSQLLSKYAEEEMDENEEEDNGIEADNIDDNDSLENNFKTSVIRHSPINISQVNKKDLSDIFSTMKVRNKELSTVHEFDDNDFETLTQENIEKFNDNDMNISISTNNKLNALQKYSDADGFEDFNDFDFDSKIKSTIGKRQNNIDIDSKINNKGNRIKKNLISTPLSKDTITSKQINRSESLRSLSSISSRTLSNKSNFSESETDHSDYADDFDDFDDLAGNKIDLIRNFKNHETEAKRKAELNKQQRSQQYDSIRNRIKRTQSFYGSNNNNSGSNNNLDDENYFENNHSAILDDFEDFKTIDPRKLYRFKVVNDRYPKQDLKRKQSMPLMAKRTSFSGSPRKIKRFSSTLDLNVEKMAFQPPKINPSIVKLPSYDGGELDDIDDLSTGDITITFSDYKKLKRKSQRVDFSKYIEEPRIRHNHRAQNQNHHYNYHNNLQYQKQDINNKFAHAEASNTTRLTKEGKLKFIRSMGKHRSRQVMPGHLYGEIVYDPDQMKWCGNEEELARFESINRPTLLTNKSSQQPKLISKSESLPQIVGNMMYDDKKLRWVSLTGKYEDDPFDDNIDEVEPVSAGFNTILKKKRIVPSGSTMSLVDQLRNDINHFEVTEEMYRGWKVEESRWLRKVGNWFPCDDDTQDFKYELKSFLNNQ